MFHGVLTVYFPESQVSNSSSDLRPSVQLEAMSSNDHGDGTSWSCHASVINYLILPPSCCDQSVDQKSISSPLNLFFCLKCNDNVIHGESVRRHHSLVSKTTWRRVFPLTVSEVQRRLDAMEEKLNASAQKEALSFIQGEPSFSDCWPWFVQHMGHDVWCFYWS